MLLKTLYLVDMSSKPPSASPSPALTGGLLALLAAALFGLSTPFVQRVGQGLGPFTTALFLYLGAALIALVFRKGTEHEARLRRNDAPRILAMATFGAVIGPVALAWGLQHTSGSGASLMLTLEALFTAIFAWLLYRESIDKRLMIAMSLLLLGGILLILDQGSVGRERMLGLLAVLIATIAWGIDNTLSRGVAERDPSQVILAKSVLGASATLVLAYLFGETMPSVASALTLTAIGASGYGLSLRAYLLAQRAFGATRTGSVFAFAPFIGALGAFLLGDRSASWGMALGGTFMLIGILLHLSESHLHEHTHESLEHEHAHFHDDGHHLHTHEGPAQDNHSHFHRHEPMFHAHPHAPDAHHQHRH